MFLKKRMPLSKSVKQPYTNTVFPNARNEHNKKDLLFELCSKCDGSCASIICMYVDVSLHNSAVYLHSGCNIHTHMWLITGTVTYLGFLDYVGFFMGQRPLVPLLLLGTPFSDYSFLVHHLANRDDWHLFATASDFSITWQGLPMAVKCRYIPRTKWKQDMALRGRKIPDRYLQSRVARWFIFKPNPQFWYIWEALWKENFDIFYDTLVYILTICCILWQFGIFWYIESRKIWQPYFRAQDSRQSDSYQDKRRESKHDVVAISHHIFSLRGRA
jgi:hypothetical protein